MAKSNYPEELIVLVEEYLTDGVVSAKERQVLLNKAQSLGVDVDEFDLYIDAQQQKVDQQVDAAAAKKRGKTCPFCGAPVPQLADKCPQCGENITPEASEKLQEIIDKLEEALVTLKQNDDNFDEAKANIERYIRKAKMYYEHNPKVKKLLEEVQTEMAAAEEKKKKDHSGLWALVLFFGLWIVLPLGYLGFDWYFGDERQIDVQHTELMNKIDELEEPNENNYIEVQNSLLKLRWKDFGNDASERDDEKEICALNDTQKESFLEAKRTVAKKIRSVYKKLNILDDIPDEINDPDNYINH